jgi:DNA invertase Pin-like site-specific DNA recombinase
MRAALYLRVSTTDQTTENQERELRGAADRLGHVSSRSTVTTASVVGRDARSGRLSTSSTGMPRFVSLTS